MTVGLLDMSIVYRAVLPQVGCCPCDVEKQRIAGHDSWGDIVTDTESAGRNC